jgi:hypothetical protein
MALPEKKYTLLESFFVFLIGGVAVVPIMALIGIAMFPIAMLTAWIRWLLWSWFVVPYLHLPMVPYWAMLGLGLLTGTLSNGDQPNGYSATTKENVTRFVSVLLAELLGLGIGYIIHTHI